MIPDYFSKDNAVARSNNYLSLQPSLSQSETFVNEPVVIHELPEPANFTCTGGEDYRIRDKLKIESNVPIIYLQVIYFLFSSILLKIFSLCIILAKYLSMLKYS